MKMIIIFGKYQSNKFKILRRSHRLELTIDRISSRISIITNNWQHFIFPLLLYHYDDDDGGDDFFRMLLYLLGFF